MTAGFVLGRMSTLPLDRFTSLHRPKHPLLFEGGNDKIHRKGIAVFHAATKQGKGLGPAAFRGLPAPLRARRWMRS